MNWTNITARLCILAMVFIKTLELFDTTNSILVVLTGYVVMVLTGIWVFVIPAPLPIFEDTSE